MHAGGTFVRRCAPHAVVDAHRRRNVAAGNAEAATALRGKNVHCGFATVRNAGFDGQSALAILAARSPNYESAQGHDRCQRTVKTDLVGRRVSFLAAVAAKLAKPELTVFPGRLELAIRWRGVAQPG